MKGTRKKEFSKDEDEQGEWQTKVGSVRLLVL
jgi:hypothetical protein